MHQHSKVPGSARMTTEPTQPQPEMGPAQANGQGQSQGHRRRRRRRKNKSSQQGAPQAQQAQPPLAAAGSASRPSRPAQHGQAADSSKAAASPAEPGTEEEEVLPEGSAPPAQPGNSISAPQQWHGAKTSSGARGRLSVPWTTATARSTATWRTGRLRRFQIIGQRPRQLLSRRVSRRLRRLRCARMRRRASSASSRICSSRPRFRRRRASSGIKVEFVKGDKEAVARLIDSPEA